MQWNKLKKEDTQARVEIQRLEETIDRIQGEAAAAENVTIDTKDYEDDVKEAEKACDDLKVKEADIQTEMETMESPIRELAVKVGETKARSSKVTNDLSKAADKYADYMRTQQQRDKGLKKKREKLLQTEAVRSKHIEVIEERSTKTKEAEEKAQRVTYHTKETHKKRKQLTSSSDNEEEDIQNDEADDHEDDYKSIEPVDTNKAPPYWKNKIERGGKEIKIERERRQITEVDPEVALQKYQRAKKDLEDKLMQVRSIEENQQSLVGDLRDRRDMWKVFRSHISNMSNDSFDEILNTKGSSGYIEFDHKKGQLNLVVQKDNNDENTQTNDVKALSGGERSFTTLSLLLALGESLETPFRVMDEFDVFLDPVARKIALENLITLAKSMENRQFIFITPQDLSSIKTDPQLKIFHLKAPIRSNLVGVAAQQTLDFQSSQ